MIATRIRVLALTAAAAALGLHAVSTAAFQAPVGQQPQQPVFRSAVDVVAVDVQVVDREGNPIKGLTAQDFSVAIDGKRRPVVSATLVEYSESDVSTAALPIRTPGRLSPDSRIFILAIDEFSFQTGAVGPAMQAARRFIQQLRPEDVVAVYAFPFTRRVLDLTHDHFGVERALARVVGRRDQRMGMFSLTPSEVVDLTAGDAEVAARVIARECLLNDPTCPSAIMAEANSIAGFYEGQAAQSLSSLSLVVRSLAAIRARKTLVLLSAGVMTSDRTGGRPNIMGLFGMIGEEAAAAETNLYVIHWDTSFLDTYSASWTAGTNAADRFATAFRDSITFRQGLELVAGKAGGALIRVEAGTGATAFDRVLRETTAYYLLGVEPVADDRDGKPHFIRVNSNVRGATVRSRTHVVIPRR